MLVLDVFAPLWHVNIDRHALRAGSHDFDFNRHGNLQQNKP